MDISALVCMSIYNMQSRPWRSAGAQMPFPNQMATRLAGAESSQFIHGNVINRHNMVVLMGSPDPKQFSSTNPFQFMLRDSNRITPPT